MTTPASPKSQVPPPPPASPKMRASPSRESVQAAIDQVKARQKARASMILEASVIKAMSPTKSSETGSTMDLSDQAAIDQVKAREMELEEITREASMIKTPKSPETRSTMDPSVQAAIDQVKAKAKAREMEREATMIKTPKSSETRSTIPMDRSSSTGMSVSLSSVVSVRVIERSNKAQPTQLRINTEQEQGQDAPPLSPAKEPVQDDAETLAKVGQYIDTLHQLNNKERVGVVATSSNEENENAGPLSTQLSTETNTGHGIRQVILSEDDEEQQYDPKTLAGVSDYIDALQRQNQASQSQSALNNNKSGLLEMIKSSSSDGLEIQTLPQETLAQVGSYIDRLARMKKENVDLSCARSGSADSDESSTVGLNLNANTTTMMGHYLERISTDGCKTAEEEDAMREIESVLSPDDCPSVSTQDLSPETLTLIGAYIDNLAGKASLAKEASTMMGHYLERISVDGFKSAEEEQAMREIRSVLSPDDDPSVSTQDLSPETLALIGTYIDNLASKASRMQEPLSEDSGTVRDTAIGADSIVDKLQRKNDTQPKGADLEENDPTAAAPEPSQTAASDLNYTEARIGIRPTQWKSNDKAVGDEEKAMAGPIAIRTDPDRLQTKNPSAAVPGPSQTAVMDAGGAGENIDNKQTRLVRRLQAKKPAVAAPRSPRTAAGDESDEKQTQGKSDGKAVGDEKKVEMADPIAVPEPPQIAFMGAGGTGKSIDNKQTRLVRRSQAKNLAVAAAPKSPKAAAAADEGDAKNAIDEKQTQGGTGWNAVGVEKNVKMAAPIPTRDNLHSEKSTGIFPSPKAKSPKEMHRREDPPEHKEDPPIGAGMKRDETPEENPQRNKTLLKNEVASLQTKMREPETDVSLRTGASVELAERGEPHVASVDVNFIEFGVKLASKSMALPVPVSVAHPLSVTEDLEGSSKQVVESWAVHPVPLSLQLVDRFLTAAAQEQELCDDDSRILPAPSDELRNAKMERAKFEKIEEVNNDDAIEEFLGRLQISKGGPEGGKEQVVETTPTAVKLASESVAHHVPVDGDLGGGSESTHIELSKGLHITSIVEDEILEIISMSTTSQEGFMPDTTAALTTNTKSPKIAPESQMFRSNDEETAASSSRGVDTVKNSAEGLQFDQGPEEKKEEEEHESEQKNKNGLLVNPNGAAEESPDSKLEGEGSFPTSLALLRVYANFAMSEDPSTDEVEKFSHIVHYAFPFFDGTQPTPAEVASIRQEARDINLSLQLVDRFLTAAAQQLCDDDSRILPAPSDELRNAKMERAKFEKIEEDNNDDAIEEFLGRLQISRVEKARVDPSAAFGEDCSLYCVVNDKEGVETDQHTAVPADERGNYAPSLASDDGPWWIAAARLAAFSSEQREAKDSITENLVSFEEDFIYSGETDEKGDLGANNPGKASNSQPKEHTSVEHDIDSFWKSRSEKSKVLQLQRGRNRARDSLLPGRRPTSFSDDARAPARFESVEDQWVRRRSMATHSKHNQWNEQWLAPKQRKVIEVDEPQQINGVEAAAALDCPAFRRNARRDLPCTDQWRLPYKERTSTHPGYFSVDVYSLYDSSEAITTSHMLDLKPWENREVKQLFLYEQSIAFCRNWFGRFRELEGIRVHQPVARPKSMEMPMRINEWSEDWYTSPWAAPLGSNLSGSVAGSGRRPKVGRRRLGPYRVPGEDDSCSSWGEIPECGTIKNVKLKIGERISRVTPDLTSSLRRSRWRKKHFPRGTFPY